MRSGVYQGEPLYVVAEADEMISNRGMHTEKSEPGEGSLFCILLRYSFIATKTSARISAVSKKSFDFFSFSFKCDFESFSTFR